MIEGIIRWSVQNRFFVLLATRGRRRRWWKIRSPIH